MADPGVGKSILALGLAYSIVRGTEFLDADTIPGRVGILDMENPASEIHKRLRRIGLTADNHDGFAYFSGVSVNLATPSGAQAVRQIIERHRLDFLVLDSFRRLAPGVDENDSRAVAAVFGPLREITDATGCTILIIHHARKRIGDNPTEAGQMVRGSGDFLASIDTLLYLRRKEAGTFALECGKSRRGIEHEPILVRVSNADDDNLTLTNEGALATADDKVEAQLARIVAALRADGGPLERKVLALRLGADPKDGTYNRALKLGWQRGTLAKDDSLGAGRPVSYALAIDEAS